MHWKKIAQFLRIGKETHSVGLPLIRTMHWWGIHIHALVCGQTPKWFHCTPLAKLQFFPTHTLYQSIAWMYSILKLTNNFSPLDKEAKKHPAAGRDHPLLQSCHKSYYAHCPQYHHHPASWPQQNHNVQGWAFSWVLASKEEAMIIYEKSNM